MLPAEAGSALHTQKAGRLATCRRARGLYSAPAPMTGDAMSEDAAGEAGPAALKGLFVRVYEELKPLARKQLAASRDATLNTTGLVHEAWLKLARDDSRTSPWHSSE